MTGIALALPELNDAGIAAMTLLLGRSNFGKEDFDGVFLVEPGGGEAPIVEGAAFAEGDQFFGDGTGGFGLGQGGCDAFVLNEAANEVGEHCVPVLTGAAQFSGSLEMAHKRVLFLLKMSDLARVC